MIRQLLTKLIREKQYHAAVLSLQNTKILSKTEWHQFYLECLYGQEKYNEVEQHSEALPEEYTTDEIRLFWAYSCVKQKKYSTAHRVCQQFKSFHIETTKKNLDEMICCPSQITSDTEQQKLLSICFARLSPEEIDPALLLSHTCSLLNDKKYQQAVSFLMAHQACFLMTPTVPLLQILFTSAIVIAYVELQQFDIALGEIDKNTSPDFLRMDADKLRQYCFTKRDCLNKMDCPVIPERPSTTVGSRPSSAAISRPNTRPSSAMSQPNTRPNTAESMERIRTERRIGGFLMPQAAQRQLQVPATPASSTIGDGDTDQRISVFRF